MSKNEIFSEILQKAKKQSEKGLEKYGTLPIAGDYNALGWLNHKTDEMMDAWVYTVALKNTVEEVIQMLKSVEICMNEGVRRKVIREAIRRLGGDSDG